MSEYKVSVRLDFSPEEYAEVMNYHFMADSDFKGQKKPNQHIKSIIINHIKKSKNVK